MKYLEDSRLTQLTSDLSGAFLNTLGSRARPSGGQGRRKNKSQSTSRQTYYAYSPQGYATYNENGASSSTGSSSRAIYGRVEAYTTKRAGSDKKTAFAVGERYAAEMDRLNEAVEALRERKKHYGDQRSDEAEGQGGNNEGGKVSKVDRRPRSRSVDGVTFAMASPPKLVYDRKANSASVRDAKSALTPLPEEVIDLTELEGHLQNAGDKRNLPLEGILKEPSALSSKRLRATSFDVSSTWRNPLADPKVEEEDNTYPLIPQPSLYRSEQIVETDGSSPTTVPRRLLTDMILTLNASFPDYDFGDAQVSDFCTLSSTEAVRRVNERLGEFAATTDVGRDFLPRFWSSIEDVLFGDLKGCEVYSYAPREGSGSGGDDPLEFLTRSMAGVGEWNTGGIHGGDVGRRMGGRVSYSLAGGGRIVSDEIHQGSPSSLSDCPPQVTLWSMNYFFVSRNKKRIVFFACVQTARTPRGSDGDNDDYDFGVDEYSGYGENNPVFDEARREKERETEDTLFPLLCSTGGNMIGSSASRESYRAPESGLQAGDESASVMVEDTDIEEGVDVDDVDGDEVHFHNDFDTGSLSAPSQAA